MRLILLFTLMFTACNGNRDHASGSQSPVKIDYIRLTTMENEPVKLQHFKGKVVFINFWATWCKPCLEEMPGIKSAMDSLKNEKIEFLFASDEAPEEVKRFEARNKFGFNYVQAVNMTEMNIANLPTTFIFDREGKQVFSEVGYRKWNDRPNIDLLLKFTR